MKFLRALALSLLVCSAFAQTGALLPGPQQFFDANGYPLAGGLVYTCAAGSSCPGTPLASYTDATLATPNANPVVLDAGGFGAIWGSTAAYKIVVENALGVPIKTYDNVTAANGAAAAVGAVVKAPAGNASQSIAGPLSIGSYAFTGGSSTLAGPLTSCVQNGMYVVGSSCYANFAAAKSAAGGACLLVPPGYAGTDGPVDGNSCILDLRHNSIASSHYFNCVYPLAGASGGADCALVANGAGDLYLSHNTQVFPATTTTTPMVAGANTVTVASTALFAAGATSPMYVGRETPNEEAIPYTNWSVVDATHLSITCTLPHTPNNANNNNASAIDIEELGLTNIDTGVAMIVGNAHKPSQLTGRGSPGVWLEENGDAFLETPYFLADPFPYNAIAVATPITGFQSGAGLDNPVTRPADVKIQNANSAVCTDLVNSAGTGNILRACDTSISVQTPITPANSGTESVGTSSLAFGNIYVGAGGGTANTQIGSNATAARTFILPDANAKAVIPGVFTSTAATSDTFTLQGVNAGSNCQLMAANSSAATNIASTYIPSAGTNTVTVNHAAVAGMVWFAHCTY